MKNLVTHALQFASSEYLPVPNTSNMSCINAFHFAGNTGVEQKKKYL